jgi:hypothetical protein
MGGKGFRLGKTVMCASGIKDASKTSGLMTRRRLTEIRRNPARGSTSLGLAGRTGRTTAELTEKVQHLGR